MVLDEMNSCAVAEDLFIEFDVFLYGSIIMSYLIFRRVLSGTTSCPALAGFCLQKSNDIPWGKP